jgi:hypothetical protein
LAFGKIAETYIALWLRRICGYSILPIYEKEIHDGKGPRFFTPNSELIAPDMLVMRGRGIKWIEAKHKTVFTWYRKAQQWQTGIDERHFNQYCEIAKRFSYPVWLLFLHASSEAKEYNGWRPSPTGLYAGELRSIASLAKIRLDTSQNKRLAYWNRSDLQELATLQEVKSAYESDPIL